MTSKAQAGTTNYTQYLKQWLSTSSGQPLLLSYSDPVAPLTVIEPLMLEAFCEASKPEGCGVCQNCRLIAAGTHPDVLVLTTAKKTWGIKEVKSWLSKLAITSASNSLKVVVICDIEKASLAAANALLKALEEASPQTHFLLTTRWPSRLLPTIISRCLRLRLPQQMPDLSDTVNAAGFDPHDLVEADITLVGQLLRHRLRHSGPSPDLKRAYLRLRDYYVISGRGGNEKLAREVLLLSLPVDFGKDLNVVN